MGHFLKSRFLTIQIERVGIAYYCRCLEPIITNRRKSDYKVDIPILSAVTQKTVEISRLNYCTAQTENGTKLLEVEPLQYNITYPSAEWRGPKGAASKTPLIVLFGWANCKDKFLAKYSKIYEDKGMITLRYIIPNQYHIWEPKKIPIVCEELIQLIFYLKLNTQPIVFHLFSNGGSIAYQEVSKSLERNPKPLMIKGVIFDSTPGERRLFPFYRYILDSFSDRKSVFTKPQAFSITSGAGISWVIEVFNNLMNPKRTDGYFEVLRYLKKEKHDWPQHCIYSKIDDMVYYYDIENFIKIRKNLGIDITSLRFEDSLHVQHYIRHKEKYVKSVYNFLNKCLTEDNINHMKNTD